MIGARMLSYYTTTCYGAVILNHTWGNYLPVYICLQTNNDFFSSSFPDSSKTY